MKEPMTRGELEMNVLDLWQKMTGLLVKIGEIDEKIEKLKKEVDDLGIKLY